MIGRCISARASPSFSVARSSTAASASFSTQTAPRPRQERTQETPARGGARARSWRDEPVPATSLPCDVSPLGLPLLKPGHLLPPPALRHTTLPNGLMVSTQETYGQVATLALFIEAGSMYETAAEVGACHFFETMAFKATEKFTASDISGLTQRLGLATSAAFNREVLLYKVDVLRGNVDAALQLIAEAVLRPKLSEEDLADGQWGRELGAEPGAKRERSESEARAKRERSETARV